MQVIVLCRTDRGVMGWLPCRQVRPGPFWDQLEQRGDMLLHHVGGHEPVDPVKNADYLRFRQVGYQEPLADPAVLLLEGRAPAEGKGGLHPRLRARVTRILPDAATVADLPAASLGAVPGVAYEDRFVCVGSESHLQDAGRSAEHTSEHHSLRHLLFRL